MRGAGTFPIEVSHVSQHGFWVLTGDEELLLPFEHFPWFRHASIDQIMSVERPTSDHRDWLWAFVDQDNIQPTNNTAERALRHAVIWRKLCFGTQSAKGSRFVERALTVIETCRLQKRNVFASVT